MSENCEPKLITFSKYIHTDTIMTDMQRYCERMFVVHRPGERVLPAAASLPTVIGPAGLHWWDLTDWSTGGK